MNSSALTATTKFPNHIILSNPSPFRSQFNQLPFSFAHTLAGHPLFELPRLVELAQTIDRIGQQSGEKFKVSCLSSNIQPHLKWSDMTLNGRIAEAIAEIEWSGSLVTIKSANLDPDYHQLMQQILLELESLTGVSLSQEMTWAEAYIFISSPHSVTPYHIDHESNFLFQIHGEKSVNLFDPGDRTILTEAEIEQYFAGNLQAANYKSDAQAKAHVFHLTPGDAVHHPSLAPHWVKNGGQYSVSLSINFCLRSLDLKARVYQVNYFLRKLGLQPASPGASSFKDSIKMATVGFFTNPKPEYKRDVVFSGIDRMKAPFNRLRQLKR